MTRVSSRNYPSLEEARAEYLRRADALVDSVSDCTPSKMAAHAAKLQEARKFLQSGEAGPWITAEATSVSVPLAQLAKSIVIAADQSESKAASVEAARGKARSLIRSADTVPSMVQAIQRLSQYLKSGEERA